MAQSGLARVLLVIGCELCVFSLSSSLETRRLRLNMASVPRRRGPICQLIESARRAPIQEYCAKWSSLIVVFVDSKSSAAELNGTRALREPD